MGIGDIPNLKIRTFVIPFGSGKTGNYLIN
jgi:hypothetical protein